MLISLNVADLYSPNRIWHLLPALFNLPLCLAYLHGYGSVINSTIHCFIYSPILYKLLSELGNMFIFVLQVKDFHLVMLKVMSLRERANLPWDRKNCVIFYRHRPIIRKNVIVFQPPSKLGNTSSKLNIHWECRINVLKCLHSSNF